MLLLVLVESMSAGLDSTLSGSEASRTLIVYQQNRYCPQTSSMPEWYAKRIAEIDGVVSVLPLKIYLNNCRASLDLVAFQGAPADPMAPYQPDPDSTHWFPPQVTPQTGVPLATDIATLNGRGLRFLRFRVEYDVGRVQLGQPLPPRPAIDRLQVRVQ